MPEEEKQDRTKINLMKDDTALIFKADGTLQMFLAEFDEKEKRELRTNEIVVVSLAALLKQPAFTNNVIESFVRMREEERRKIRKENPNLEIPKDADEIEL